MLGSNINIDQNRHMMVLFSWGYYIEVPEPNGGFCRKIIELNRRFSSKACLIARVKWRILQALVCQAFNESSWAEFHLMIFDGFANSFEFRPDLTGAEARSWQVFRQTNKDMGEMEAIHAFQYDI